MPGSATAPSTLQATPNDLEAFWLPLPMNFADEAPVNVIMRLAPGVTKEVAEQQLNQLNVRLAAEHPQEFPQGQLRTVMLNYMDITQATGEMSSSLHLLLAAVGLLLLIACLNVANLLQSRTESRRREYALRLALGAKPGRLMQQTLIESGVLAGLGCVSGIALTFAGISVFRAMSDNLPLTERLRVDWRVLMFTVVVSGITALIFGLAPAWQASRTDPNGALREGERGNIGKSRGLVRRGLAVAEIALAMVLLVGAGLMINTVSRLASVDPGFDPHNILMAEINLPDSRSMT